MLQEELLRRIHQRLEIVGLSERQACLRARVGADFVRDIRRRGHSPKADKLARLAGILQTTPAYLLDAVVQEPTLSAQPTVTVWVRGAVEAGVFRSAIEWPIGDRYPLSIPADRRYPRAELFGLEVRGTSMDQLYPEGTVVIVIRFADAGRAPEVGDKVVVLRRSPEDSGYEATLKEYRHDRQGRHVLWPRSTDPEFQTPLILGSDDLAFSDYFEPLHAAGEPDIVISALVVSSLRPE